MLRGSENEADGIDIKGGGKGRGARFAKSAMPVSNRKGSFGRGRPGGSSDAGGSETIPEDHLLVLVRAARARWACWHDRDGAGPRVKGSGRGAKSSGVLIPRTKGISARGSGVLLLLLLEGRRAPSKHEERYNLASNRPLAFQTGGGRASDPAAWNGLVWAASAACPSLAFGRIPAIFPCPRWCRIWDEKGAVWGRGRKEEMGDCCRAMVGVAGK